MPWGLVFFRHSFTNQCFYITDGAILWHHGPVNRKHRKTLAALYTRPTKSDLRWRDIEQLLGALGADIEERSGSRVAVIFPNQPPAIFHRPHPSPNADRGAVTAVRKWIESMGIEPEE